MPLSDAWEWHILLYVGTVVLKRSEVQFWRMTPRKLNALFKAHIELNSSKEDSEASKQGYIDQVL